MAKQPDKQEIVASTPTSLANQSELDSLLGEYAGAGTENVTSQDILLPRLLLLQPTSPLASVEPFRAGYFANSVDETSFGTNANFYVVHYYPSRVHWASEELGGPVDCRSQDNLTGSVKDEVHGHGLCAKCSFNMWSKSDKDGRDQPPKCKEFKNLIVVPANNVNSVPLLFSVKSTGLRAIMQFLSSVKFDKLPIFAHAYNIASLKTENDKGTFYIPKLTRGAKVGDVVTTKKLIELHTSMKAAQDRIVGPSDDVEGDAGSEEGSSF